MRCHSARLICDRVSELVDPALMYWIVSLEGFDVAGDVAVLCQKSSLQAFSSLNDEYLAMLSSI